MNTVSHFNLMESMRSLISSKTRSWQDFSRPIKSMLRHDNYIMSSFQENSCGMPKNLNGFLTRDKKFMDGWYTFLQMLEKSSMLTWFFPSRRTYNHSTTCDNTTVSCMTPFGKRAWHMASSKMMVNGVIHLTKPSIFRPASFCMASSSWYCETVFLLIRSHCGNNISLTSVTTCPAFSPVLAFTMWRKMQLKIMDFISCKRLSFGAWTGLWRMLAWSLLHETGIRSFLIISFRIICSLTPQRKVNCLFRQYLFWTMNNVLHLIE